MVTHVTTSFFIYFCYSNTFQCIQIWFFAIFRYLSDEITLLYSTISRIANNIRFMNKQTEKIVLFSKKFIFEESIQDNNLKFGECKLLRSLVTHSTLNF